MRSWLQRGLCLGAGLCLGLAYQPWSLGWLVFPGYGLLWSALAAAPSRAVAAVYGWVAGALHLCVGFFWAQSFHPLALLALILVHGGLFFALPSFFVHRWLRYDHGAAPLLVAAVWVLSETIREQWALSFPFGQAGYALGEWRAFVQLADLGGVHLVSLAVFGASTAGWQLLRRLRTLGRPGWAGSFGLLVAFSVIPPLYGLVRVGTLGNEEQPVAKVGIAQTRQAGRGKVSDETMVSTVEKLVDQAHGLNLDLLVFPELTLNRPLTFDPAISLPGNTAIWNRVSIAARDAQTPLVLGSVERKMAAGATRTYNSVSLFDGKGSLAGVYRKQRLVPLGETNPLGSLAPWLSEYMTSTTDALILDRGESSSPLSVTVMGRALPFGVLVCFEDCFGDDARARVGSGATWLISVTDDLWALSPALMVQHATMTSFRAIETRVPILRAANGGLSGYFDPTGAFATGLSIGEEGLSTSQLYLPKQPWSLYRIVGDWPAALCGAILLLFVIRRSCSRVFRNRARSGTDTPG